MVMPTPSSLPTSSNLAQISEALQEGLPGFDGLDQDLELLPEDITGDGVPDQVARYRNGDVYQALIYTDVSGDGEPDLIVQASEAFTSSSHRVGFSS